MGLLENILSATIHSEKLNLPHRMEINNYERNGYS